MAHYQTDETGSPYLWIVSLSKALATSCAHSGRVGVGFSPSQVGADYHK